LVSFFATDSTNLSASVVARATLDFTAALGRACAFGLAAVAFLAALAGDFFAAFFLGMVGSLIEQVGEVARDDAAAGLLERGDLLLGQIALLGVLVPLGGRALLWQAELVDGHGAVVGRVDEQ